MVLSVEVGEILIDRFHILRQLGEGGRGTVFEALDLKTGGASRPEILQSRLCAIHAA